MDGYFQVYFALRPLQLLNKSYKSLQTKGGINSEAGQSSWEELPFLPQGGVPLLFSLHLAAQMARKLIGGRKL